jgi:hypothetical protein
MWHIVHVLSLSAGQYFCNLANVHFGDLEMPTPLADGMDHRKL